MLKTLGCANRRLPSLYFLENKTGWVDTFAEKKFDCSTLGDVLLDVLVQTQVEDFKSLAKGGTGYCALGRIDFGGSGNVASMLSLLNMKTAFIGKAGKDQWGKLYKQDLNSKGISTEIFSDQRKPTGLTIAFFAKDGERSFLVFRGANDELTCDEIETVADVIKQSKILYFSGYSLWANPQRTAVVHAVDMAKKFRVKIVFDPGAYNIVQSNTKLFFELFDKCDVFCPNADEAKALTDSETIAKAVRELRHRDKIIAIKLGGQGCVIIDNDQVVKIPAFKTNVIDTTGAGDAFAGGLIYGIVKGLPLFSIGKLANWLAAQTSIKIGARNFPSRAEIRSFLKELNRREIDR